MSRYKQDLEQLAKLRNFTSQLFKASELGDWSRVESLLKQREQLIREIDLQPASAEQADQYREVIAAVQRDDETLSEQAKEHRQAILDRLKSEDKGNRMKAAYALTRKPY